MAISWKAEKVWIHGLGEKQIIGAAEVREPWMQRKAIESGVQRDTHREHCPKPTDWGNESS